MPQYPYFIGPSYTSQSRIASCDRCVNWYPEKIEAPGGKTSWALYPAPGYEIFATLPEGPVRAMLQQNGRVFAVGGTKLFEIDSAGDVTELATGINNPDDAPAAIHGNGDGGDDLFIRASDKGYSFDLDTSTLTLEIDGCAGSGYLDGFFLALNSNLSRLKISNLFDGGTWETLQFAQRSAAPDRWTGVLVTNKQIWLFGTNTSEIWYNAGAAPFPFLPNPSAFIEHGAVSQSAIAVLDNAPAWLGRSADGAAVVYRANGFTPTRISNHAIEYALSQYETLSDVEAWTYQDQGHSFFVLTFPTAGATWVFDAATGAWHERGSWDGVTFKHLPVRGHIYAFDKHLVGGMNSGRIYRMSIDLAADVYEL